ncbi:selenoprotein S isoform X2 [Chanos chanos]|uniref:Selenoprotein S isoform X2 n=1 Tax=Chanos chanos TaxID=29144 RepID=A0A6J2UNQ8_CHACN|nr:selenoprotein S isoform X2 [Chanos chanos]
MEADDEASEIKTERNLDNQDLSFLQTYATGFLAEYGWYVLFVCVGIYLLIQHLNKNRRNQEQSATASTVDPASVVRRQEALEAARQRMQEELNAKAAEYREKQQKLEEEKRRQKIEMWESMKEGKSYKGNQKFSQNTEEASSSTVLKPKTDKKPLRNSGFNPLSGEGGGTCTWRPGRRGPSAGG